MFLQSEVIEGSGYRIVSGPFLLLFSLGLTTRQTQGCPEIRACIRKVKVSGPRPEGVTRVNKLEVPVVGLFGNKGFPIDCSGELFSLWDYLASLPSDLVEDFWGCSPDIFGAPYVISKIHAWALLRHKDIIQTGRKRRAVRMRFRK